MQKNLENKPKNITTDNGELRLNFQVPNRDNTIEKNANQMHLCSKLIKELKKNKLENKAINITTYYGELSLLGSKSGQFPGIMQFRCTPAKN